MLLYLNLRLLVWMQASRLLPAGFRPASIPKHLVDTSGLPAISSKLRQVSQASEEAGGPPYPGGSVNQGWSAFRLNFSLRGPEMCIAGKKHVPYSPQGSSLRGGILNVEPTLWGSHKGASEGILH